MQLSIYGILQRKYDPFSFFFSGFPCLCEVVGAAGDLLPPCRSVYRLDCVETDGVHVSSS